MTSVKTLTEMANRRAFNRRSQHSGKYPTYLNIETICGCNLRCVMCPIGTGGFKRKNKVMDQKLFKKIISEVAGKTRYAWLHFFGEPLLDPYIFDRIKFCKSNGLKTQISTNATLLTKEKAGQLLESGLDDMIISLDGATKRTYEAIRKRGDFNRTMTNVRYFLELKKKRGIKRPFVRVQIIRMSENEKEIDSFIKKWKDLADAITIKPLGSWAGQVDIGKHKKSGRKLPERYPCLTIWEQLTILADGKVAVCCYDFNGKNIIGDLNKQTVAEVFNGPRIRTLRLMQARGKFNIPPCNTCVEWSWQPKKVSLAKTMAKGIMEDTHLFYPIIRLWGKLKSKKIEYNV